MARFRPFSALVGVLVLGLVAASSRGANPLLVDGARPQRIVVTLPGTEWDDSLAAQPEMARRLSGVVAVLEGESLKALFEATGPGAPPRGEPTTAPMLEVRLIGRSSTSSARLDPVGPVGLRLVDEAGGWVMFNRAKFLAALGPAALYRGDFSKSVEPVARVFEFTGSAERIGTLDARTVRSRLYRAGGGGGASALPVSNAKFAARLPKEFDPRDPPGLVVWCSPTDPWAVPEQLHRALDEHNLIAIGALDGGNERPVFDRLQLALDAAATAMATWPIDTRRVYLVGMSGGAKVAVMLWAGWPEVFSGAVPIVGMASYKSEAAPNGGAYPPLFSKPAPATLRTLKEHRVGAMTGPPDFNHDSILKMAKGLERDGLPVRVFEHADMAHTMPTPERFEEAMRWIDEPYQTARRAEIAAAETALRGAGDADRDALLEVMRTGPWTPAAWEAWDRLSGLPPARPAP